MDTEREQGPSIGEDGVPRCPWGAGGAQASAQRMRDYHDTEWGVPIRDESGLFERLVLEAFQSGLSWSTILNKRESFCRAFAGFDPELVAAYDDSHRDRLLADSGIVRNRAKVDAAIGNARATLALRSHGGLVDLIWSFRPDSLTEPRTVDQMPAQTAESKALAKALRSVGFTFVGPTTAYALMTAVGVDDGHLVECHRRGLCPL